MAVCQSRFKLTDTPPSGASPLPHLLWCNPNQRVTPAPAVIIGCTVANGLGVASGPFVASGLARVGLRSGPKKATALIQVGRGGWF